MLRSPYVKFVRHARHGALYDVGGNIVLVGFKKGTDSHALWNARSELRRALRSAGIDPFTLEKQRANVRNVEK